MADDPALIADFVARLEWMLTDLDDLWVLFDNGQNEELMEALGTAIRGVSDAKAIFSEEVRTNDE